MSTEPGLTWAEQETIGALRRLARAQAQVAATREASAASRSGPFDPDDAARLEQVHQDLLDARERSTGRFAKGAARHAVRDLEAIERQVLDRLQMATYDDYRARVAAAGPPAAPFDPAMADFARRELEAAWLAWRELRALPVDIDLTTPRSDPVDRT